jgi:hypothetical protein
VRVSICLHERRGGNDYSQGRGLLVGGVIGEDDTSSSTELYYMFVRARVPSSGKGQGRKLPADNRLDKNDKLNSVPKQCRPVSKAIDIGRSR